MDLLDDFDDALAYDLSSADEISPSDEEQEGLELPGAELRIEGDFKYAASLFHRCVNMIIVSSRLVQNIRLADDSSSVGVLGREWDLNIGEQEVEFRDDLRAASGIGKRRRKVWCCRRLSAGLSDSLNFCHSVMAGVQGWYYLSKSKPSSERETKHTSTKGYRRAFKSCKKLFE